MKLRKRNAFTLIELVAVLVIMAILALIVTPLVLNIIRKARTAADKRSIDAYGRSIEIAIAGYLLDNGTFPTSIGQLTIEYSGDEVVCSTTQLNGDSSVYLTGCTVGGRSVDYSYGTDKTPPAPTYTAYSVGDEVSYNNVDYYVIADSGTSEANVTLLKKTPLTVSEVNQYGGVGTSNNHVNEYVTNCPRCEDSKKAYNNNGYGGMAYYTSATCGANERTNCITSYAQSEIKYVVDAWAADKVPNGLVEARLITIEELRNSLGYGNLNDINSNVPSWVYNDNYGYWTGSSVDNFSIDVWLVNSNGNLYSSMVCSASSPVVRPVIVLPKSVLQ